MAKKNCSDVTFERKCKGSKRAGTRRCRQLAEPVTVRRCHSHHLHATNKQQCRREDMGDRSLKTKHLFVSCEKTARWADWHGRRGI